MRLPKQVRKALDETGKPFEIKKGKKHHKIVVGGKLVGIWPYGKATAADRATKNIVAQIRRAA